MSRMLVKFSQKGFGMVWIFIVGILVITILVWLLDLSGSRLQNKIPPSSLKSELIDSGVKQYEFNKSKDQIFYLKGEVDKTIKVKAILYDTSTNSKKLITELENEGVSNQPFDYEIFRTKNGESYFTIFNNKYIYKLGLDEKVTPYKLTTVNDIRSVTEQARYQLSNEDVLQVGTWCRNVVNESVKVLYLESGENSYYFIEEKSGNFVVFRSDICKRYGGGANVNTGNNFSKLVVPKNINFIDDYSSGHPLFKNISDPKFQIENITIVKGGCQFFNDCLTYTNILFQGKVFNRNGNFVQNMSNYYLSKENSLFVTINEDLIKIFGN